MQLVFAWPSHENGGCIFADPTQISRSYEPSCPVVFLDPHSGDGCIFADPRVIDPRDIRGGGGFQANYWEEEGIIAVIAAWMTKH